MIPRYSDAVNVQNWVLIGLNRAHRTMVRSFAGRTVANEPAKFSSPLFPLASPFNAFGRLQIVWHEFESMNVAAERSPNVDASKGTAETKCRDEIDSQLHEVLHSIASACSVAIWDPTFAELFLEREPFYQLRIQWPHSIVHLLWDWKNPVPTKVIAPLSLGFHGVISNVKTLESWIQSILRNGTTRKSIVHPLIRKVDQQWPPDSLFPSPFANSHST